MKVFDCQAHIEDSFEKYDIPDIFGKNVIFNSIESYKKNHLNVGLTDSISLVFDFKHNLDFVLDTIESKPISALKVHSRIQELSRSDYPVLIENLKKAPLELPVIIDAFYWGGQMQFQPSLSGIVEILEAFPDKTFIIAHGGGVHVQEYFVHLRPFKNVIHDLSYSLEYFSDSSLFQDFKKLIKWTAKDRLMFGSDFPDASPRKQFDLLKLLLDELGVSSEEQAKVFFENAVDLFKPQGL